MQRTAEKVVELDTKIDAIFEQVEHLVPLCKGLLDTTRVQADKLQQLESSMHDMAKPD